MRLDFPLHISNNSFAARLHLAYSTTGAECSLSRSLFIEQRLQGIKRKLHADVGRGESEVRFPIPHFKQLFRCKTASRLQYPNYPTLPLAGADPPLNPYFSSNAFKVQNANCMQMWVEGDLTFRGGGCIVVCQSADGGVCLLIGGAVARLVAGSGGGLGCSHRSAHPLARSPELGQSDS